MALQVLVMSRETIKPSLPTPQPLKDFKLSLIDQRNTPLHMPVILFYPAAANSDQANLKPFDLLKKSLSETLTRFYPLAGRINDNHLVQCNDNGVEYIETQVGGELNRVVSNPKQEDLLQLLPCDVSTLAIGSAPLISIQVNKFECGGIAMAICGSHKILDAGSLYSFISNWAETASESNEQIGSPKFDAATIFPPAPQADYWVPITSPMSKVFGKRFIFDSSNISALKAKVSKTILVEKPTKVEVVAALLWKCALKASKQRVGFLKPSQVSLSTDIRRRITPPLAYNSFGNIATSLVTSLTSTNENEIDLHCLVGKLKEAKKKVEEDFKLKKHPVDAYVLVYESGEEAIARQAKRESDFFFFSCWCRVPLYEIDFGWGKPIWTTIVNSLLKNTFLLMDTKSGDGVEASVYLDEEDAMKFESDEELLAYAFPVTST